MLESIIVYSLLVAVMSFCGAVAASREKKYIGGSGVYSENRRFFRPEIIVLAVSFALVFGCRWGVGRDYFRYLYAYTEAVPERFEFLFQGISQLLFWMGAHFSVYFTVWALLDVVLLYYAVKDYRFIFPYIAFFLIFGSYYLPMMNAIRQCLAALFFLNSVRYIEQKQLLKFCLCVVVAILFHRLSVILFIFYPLLRRKDDWFEGIWLQLILFAVAVFLSFKGELIIRWIEAPYKWITDLLGYKIYQYDFLYQDRYDRTRFGSNTGLGIWVKILVTVPVIVLSIDFKKYYNSSLFNMFYSLFFVGVITSLLFGSSVVLNRLSMFFSIFELIIRCFFVYYCFTKKTYTYYFIGLMMFLIQIPLFINMISNPSSTAPFLFFWQGAAVAY